MEREEVYVIIYKSRIDKETDTEVMKVVRHKPTVEELNEVTMDIYRGIKFFGTLEDVSLEYIQTADFDNLAQIKGGNGRYEGFTIYDYAELED